MWNWTCPFQVYFSPFYFLINANAIRHACTVLQLSICFIQSLFGSFQTFLHFLFSFKIICIKSLLFNRLLFKLCFYHRWVYILMSHFYIYEGLRNHFRSLNHSQLNLELPSKFLKYSRVLSSQTLLFYKFKGHLYLIFCTD